MWLIGLIICFIPISALAAFVFRWQMTLILRRHGYPTGLFIWTDSRDSFSTAKHFNKI